MMLTKQGNGKPFPAIPLLTEEIKRKYGKRIKKNPFRNNRVIRICG